MNTRKTAWLISLATVPALLAAFWMLSSPADAADDYITTTTTTAESTTTTTAPVPQAFVTVDATMVCTSGVPMVVATISNDSELTVFVDINVDGKDRAGLQLGGSSAIDPEFPLPTFTEGGTVTVTITYNDGGLGVFTVTDDYQGLNECQVPIEIIDAISQERDDVYVTPSTTVPAPVSSTKPLRFAG